MTPKPESETDPWAKVVKSTIRARIADYSVTLLGHSRGSQQAKENAQTAIDVAIDAARAAEAAQHRREVAALEHEAEHDLVLLDHVIALLKPTVEPEPPTLEPCAHELDYHNCAECVGPKVEPEPCAWRITSGPLGTWVNPTCVEGAIPAPWGTERAKACHLCGAPLKVEREP